MTGTLIHVCGATRCGAGNVMLLLSCALRDLVLQPLVCQKNISSPAYTSLVVLTAGVAKA